MQVVNLRKKLIDLLNKEFQLYGIDEFTYPIFYNLRIGLRFELGMEIIEDEDEYINESVRRACNIFNDVFAADDDILLVIDTTPDKELKQKLLNAIMQRVRIKLNDKKLNKASNKCDTYFYRYIYFLKGRNFPSTSIFKRIAQSDFGKGKNYCNSVYIFNLRINVLFHMYDDRGIDLIAADKDILKPFYKKLNHMLLDYDRTRMSNLFEN